MIRKLKRLGLHYDIADPFSILTAPKPRSRFSSLVRTYRRINPMKHSPHREQARLPLAAGRIAAATARTETIRHSKAGTKVAPTGLLSVLDGDEDSSQVHTSGIFRCPNAARLIALYSGSAVLLGAFRAKSELSSFI